MATKPNKQYEAMFLLGSSFASDVDGAVKLCRTTLEKHGAEILTIKKWDERKLAYEIGKSKRGLYVIAYFKAPGTAIAVFERDVKLSEEFVRVMVTDASHLSQEEMDAVEPQPIAPPQPERAPWDLPMGGFDGGGRESRGDSRGPRGPRRRDDAGAAAESAAGKD